MIIDGETAAVGAPHHHQRSPKKTSLGRVNDQVRPIRTASGARQPESPESPFKSDAEEPPVAWQP